VLVGVEDFGGVEVEGGLGSLGVVGTYDWAGDGLVRCGLLVVVLLGMVGMSDNLLVVDWLISGHYVFGGLGSGAIPSGVCTVFAVKEAVEPSRLRRPASTSASGVGTAALLCGLLLATSCVTGGVLVGDGVHLLMVVVWPTGFGLSRSDPCSTGLRGVLGFPLGFYLVLM
jgi:hypothetical protein